MVHEVETKVLDVDAAYVAKTLEAAGAEKILETRLLVDWFRLKGTKEGTDPWFLRIRTQADGIAEITWKGKSDTLGVSRKHREINFHSTQPAKVRELFGVLGFEQYAYQEKDRTSWTFKSWRFDLDKYPGMPAYLEIEGRSEKHIKEAIALLKLEGHAKSAEGERLLIQSQYRLNWYNMRFRWVK